MTDNVPTREDVLAAAERIRGRVHNTPLMRCRAIDEATGCEVWLKTENLQKTGAFKARGASNAILSMGEDALRRGVSTHSSGNHGAALAYAAREAGASATVVMPLAAPAAKKRAVASYGARIVDCDNTLAAREATLADVVAKSGASVVHPYNDPRVIAGQGTAALEILQSLPGVNAIVAPVGGGGLLSGTALAAEGGPPVWGAEPATVDDAAQSMETGVHAPLTGRHTIADGLRTRLGERGLAILRRLEVPIIRVQEATIVRAMRLLFERAKLVVEPSGAVPLAALLEARESGRGPEGQVALILSGGNVDLDTLFTPLESATGAG